MVVMLRGANAGGAWYPIVAETVPDNPPAGQIRMYGKPHQTSLYYRDSAGNEYELRPSQRVANDNALYNTTKLYALNQYLAETFR